MRPGEVAGSSEGLASLPRWRLVAALTWTALVLLAASATYVVDRMQLCSTQTVHTPQRRETETSTLGEGRAHQRARRGPSRTTKVQTASTVTTMRCSGASLPGIALALLPAVAVLSPSLKSFDVAGLFGAMFRDVERKLDVQQEQVDRVARDVAEIRVTQQTLVGLGIKVHVGDVISAGLDASKGSGVSDDEVVT
jgi:hypothetical protein